MPALVTCPSCANRFAPPGEASANLRCPSCGQTFRTDSTAFDVAQAILGGLDDEPQRPAPPPSAAPPREAIQVPDPHRPLTFDSKRGEYEAGAAPLNSPYDRDASSFRLPPPEPPAGNGKQWTAGISTVVVVGLIVLRGCAAFMRNQPDHRPVAVNPPPAFNNFNDFRIKPFQAGRGVLVPEWNDPILPIRPAKQTNEQRDREIRELVASLQAPVRDQQLTLVGASFDWGRFRERLEVVGDLNRETTRDPQFLQSLVRVLERDLFASNLAPWTDADVRNIQALPNGDATATVRCLDGKGGIWFDRWRFSRRTGSWKFYEVEFLDSGGSFAGSILCAPESLYPDPAARQSMFAVDQALRFINDRKPELAEQQLNQVVGHKLKGHFATMHALAKGRLHESRNQWQQAAESLRPIADQHVAFPAIDYYLGIASNRLNLREALAPLERFHAISGDDARICYELAEAHRLAQRFDEAAKLYRTSLDIQPAWGGTYLGLLRSLRPEDAREDLAQRFEKLDKREDDFRTCAEDCRMAKDWESLELIARTMDRLTPGHGAAPAYLAVALAGLGKTDDAAQVFKRVPGLQGGPIGARQEVFWFIDEMTQQGKGREAYAAIPDARAMFPQLVAAAKKTVHPGQLRLLAAEHAKRHPDDPYVRLCKAENLAAAFDDKAADKLFDEACRQQLDPGVVGAFRPTRVAVRYRLGNAVSAYKEIGPRHETFSQLQLLCKMSKDQKTLDEIIDLHAQNDATDPLLVNELRIRLVKQGKTDEAIAPLAAELLRVNDPIGRSDILRPFLHAVVDAELELPFYAKLPESILSDAFNLLGNDLAYGKKPDRLEALIAAHRKRMPNDLQIPRLEAAAAVRAKDHAKAAEKFLISLKAKEDPQIRNAYLIAAANSGKAADAFKSLKGTDRDFAILGRQLAQKKSWDELGRLFKEYAPKGSTDPVYLGLLARRQIAAKEWDIAEKTLAKYKSKSNDSTVYDDSVYAITSAFFEADRPLDAYRLSPNRSIAFDIVARRLTTAKKPDELAKLLEQHAKNFPKDNRTRIYQAELKLLRNDPEGAIALLDNGKRTGRMFGLAYLEQNVVNRAYLQKGNVKEAYQKAGRNESAFRLLADECVRQKKADELERLIAVHRENDPADPDFRWREIQLHYLRNDHAAVLREADAFLKDRKANQSPIAYLRLRAMIQLKKYDEVLKETEARSETEMLVKPIYLLALAKKGDTAGVTAAMEKWSREDTLFVGDCWADPEFAAILREPGFADLRARYPDPVDGDRFNPDDDDS
ncbi:MAG: hypothetical protein K2X38_24695 [Gemmataceae bacterium]|nr:hypothetical protein [Gemmataceae bacterium]